MITVRKATPADKAAVLEICYAIDPHDYLPDMYDESVSGDHPGGLYVAELDGRIVGCHAVDWPRPDATFFFAMRIDPRVQGQGIGSAYAGAQVAAAVAEGARHLTLSSALGNFRAHRAVEKNGFVNAGPWFIYEDQPAAAGAAGQPARARSAVAADLPRVAAFLDRLKGEALADMLPAIDYPYGFAPAQDDDWALEDLVVADGPEGALVGVMLLRQVGEQQLYIRRLEGTAEAAADLLGYAAAWGGARGLTLWMASLPARCEALLAPLGWDPEKCERWYIFRYDVK